MKKYLITFCITLVSFLSLAQEIQLSQDNKTENYNDLDQNLDLEIVATIFGISSNIEEFEKRLNNPKYKVSNLDLDNDGKVDYLKVMEKSKENTKTVIIQASLPNYTFKTVASIVITKNKKNKVSLKIIGDNEIYGEEYVIIPTYKTTPKVVVWFWKPSYNIWVSPYKYGYYPKYYKSWVTVPTVTYRRGIRTRVIVKTPVYIAPRRRITVRY